MERQGVCDAVLKTAEVPDAIRQWIVGGSPEAGEVREQLELIIRFFVDLDAGMDRLGPGDQAYLFSRQVRAEMIQDVLLTGAGHLAGEGAPSTGHPIGSLLRSPQDA